MFSGGVDVVLEYRTAPAITNDSLSKRTMKVMHHFRFLVKCGQSAKWMIMMVFKVQYVHIQEILTTCCGEQ